MRCMSCVVLTAVAPSCQTMELRQLRVPRLMASVCPPCVLLAWQTCCATARRWVQEQARRVERLERDPEPSWTAPPQSWTAPSPQLQLLSCNSLPGRRRERDASCRLNKSGLKQRDSDTQSSVRERAPSKGAVFIIVSASNVCAACRDRGCHHRVAEVVAAARELEGSGAAAAAAWVGHHRPFGCAEQVVVAVAAAAAAGVDRSCVCASRHPLQLQQRAPPAAVHRAAASHLDHCLDADPCCAPRLAAAAGIGSAGVHQEAAATAHLSGLVAEAPAVAAEVAVELEPRRRCQVSPSRSRSLSLSPCHCRRDPCARHGRRAPFLYPSPCLCGARATCCATCYVTAGRACAPSPCAACQHRGPWTRARAHACLTRAQEPARRHARSALARRRHRAQPVQADVRYDRWHPMPGALIRARQLRQQRGLL